MIIASPHVSELTLMHFPHVVMIICAYLGTVYTGLKFIKNGINNEWIKCYTIGHNSFLATLSLYMAIEIFSSAIEFNYSLFGNQHALYTQQRMAKVLNLFYLSKILEFNDTFIMLIRKNFRQVSFLHVYHHASIFPIWWLVIYMAPTGDSYFSALLNSVVHVIMYLYYLLSAAGVKVSRIKRYITKIQMTQFVLMMIQATYNLLTKSEKREGFEEYPKSLSALLWIYMTTMLGLFFNFNKKSG